MLASQGTYINLIKHSKVFIDPASKAISTAENLTRPDGTTQLPPLEDVQSIG